MKVLEQQPNIGRPVLEMAGAYREWLVDFGDSGCVARYRVDAEAVTILALRHHKEVGCN